MAQVERSAELGAMLRHLNHFVVENLAGSAFYFTVAAVRFNRLCRSLQFAGAGHPPVMIVGRGKSPRLLESKSMILGLFENAVEAEAIVEVPLEAGDRVVVYTDGLSENFNARREMLGVDGLGKIVSDTLDLPLAEMKQQIIERVAAWRNGPAADDISLVLMEVR
jgi:serine phosphatase RsbU (regulator of sigma subunit)